MKFYHSTTRANADAILASGFCDAEGNYFTDGIHRGVWLSSVPLDPNEGTKGDVLLAVEVEADGVELEQWEWIEDRKLYREWLVPAEWLNATSTVRELTDDEADAAREAGWNQRLELLRREETAR